VNPLAADPSTVPAALRNRAATRLQPTAVDRLVEWQRAQERAEEWGMSTTERDHEERRRNRRYADRLLESVTRTLGLYSHEASPATLFNGLLADLLDLTDSAYGYIGEVLHDPDGAPYLRTWAITDISWSPETEAMYQEHAVHGGGFEFRNLDTLFGWGLRDGGRVVIANDTATDARAAGRPGGHPPLDCYLAVPVFRGSELVGQLGVANRPGGYDHDLVDALAPFTAAVGHLVDAYRTNQSRRTAEAELAASERRLAAMVDHLSDIVTVLGVDGTWVSSSPAATRLLGHPRGIDTPHGVFDFLHPDDVPVALDAFTAVLEGSRDAAEPLELRVRAADGSYRIFETTGVDLRADPAVAGILVTSHDVTANRIAEAELRESTSQLAALVSSLHDAVLFLDDDNTILFTNRRFAELFDYHGSPEELVGRSTAAIRNRALDLVVDGKGFVARLDAVYARGTRVEDERVEFADGTVLERDYTPVELAPGRRGHLWIYRDITQRVAVEQQRARLLEQEREMREAIEEQNQSLRELDVLKTEFVATVSHELRTPLSSIVGFADFLADDAASFTSDQQEFIDVIRRNARRLLDLVGDLLLIARLESGALPVEVESVDLPALVESVVDEFRCDAEAGGVALRYTGADAVRPVAGDPGRLAQVVTNLVSNAVKFTPAGGTVDVRVLRVRGEWGVEVQDTGMGIPEEEMQHLFQRFYRASNARLDEVPGTGLGLAISKAILDLHGGALAIDSVEGAGTVVRVTLPDDAARNRAPRPVAT